MSNSLRPHGLNSPWNPLGQNTGVGGLFLHQRNFPTQGLNPGVLHCRQIPYQLSYKGSPRILEWVAYPFSRRSSQPRNQTWVSCVVGRFFTNWAIREALSKLKGSPKNSPIWASMVVQWLRLHAPNAGGLGSVPGQGTRSHMPHLRPSAVKKKKKVPFNVGEGGGGGTNIEGWGDRVSSKWQVLQTRFHHLQLRFHVVYLVQILALYTNRLSCKVQTTLFWQSDMALKLGWRLLYTAKLFKWQMKAGSWNYGDMELLHKSSLVLQGVEGREP